MAEKYCIYFPCTLNKNALINAKTDEDLLLIFNNYILYNDQLDNRLEIITHFMRIMSNDNLILLKHDNKIFAIIISRNAYRPFKILPVISDLANLQCFIAIDLQWNELPEFNKNIDNNIDKVFITEDNILIQDIYNKNRERLIPILEKSYDKMLTHFFYLEESK